MNAHLSQEEAPILQFVSRMLEKACQEGASDIHWEPLETRLRVRFRIDGTLREVEQIPKKLQGSIINRFKMMASSMDIAEKRLPQEGRFQVTIQGKVIDVRVSVIPTLYGESVVLRLLEASSFSRPLSELGLWEDDWKLLTGVIRRPDGLVLVTGPTGSGKTTTLYAALSMLNNPDCKIITVEDPVEYQLPGINQVSVNEEIGRSFPVVLRSMLRQAINVIMVGEIRDRVTASIVMNAAQTGHLVFSTLHTNSAPGAVLRLEDLGIPSFLVSDALRAVIAQRLVRRLCPHCKVPHGLSQYEIEVFQLSREQVLQGTPMKAPGCDHCCYQGWRGRLGIFEIMTRNQFLEEGSQRRTLRDDALRKMLAGLISPQEVLSVTLGVDESHKF